MPIVTVKAMKISRFIVPRVHQQEYATHSTCIVLKTSLSGFIMFATLCTVVRVVKGHEAKLQVHSWHTVYMALWLSLSVALTVMWGEYD